MLHICGDLGLVLIDNLPTEHGAESKSESIIGLDVTRTRQRRTEPEQAKSSEWLPRPDHWLVQRSSMELFPESGWDGDGDESLAVYPTKARSCNVQQIGRQLYRSSTAHTPARTWLVHSASRASRSAKCLKSEVLLRSFDLLHPEQGLISNDGTSE